MDHMQPLVKASGESPLNWEISGVDTRVVLCLAKLPLEHILLSHVAEGAGCIGRVVVVQGCTGCLV